MRGEGPPQISWKKAERPALRTLFSIKLGTMSAALLTAAAAFLGLAAAQKCSEMLDGYGGNPQPYSTFPYKITVSKERQSTIWVSGVKGISEISP